MNNTEKAYLNESLQFIHFLIVLNSFQAQVTVWSKYFFKIKNTFLRKKRSTLQT